MSDSRELCPICEEGHLHAQVGKNTVQYRGHSADLDIHFSICDVCGSEQAGSADLRRNKRSTIKFRKQVDGLLTGSEVRIIRKKLGLNQADAACLFGGGPVAFSKYENDDIAQSEAMDKLLRLISEMPSTLERLWYWSDKKLNYQQSRESIINYSSFVKLNGHGLLNNSGVAYGVDACKGGWFCVAIDAAGKLDAFIVERLENLIDKAGKHDRIFVDIPIGIADGFDERLCDKEARKKLGQPRGSSVFRIPVRASLSVQGNEMKRVINKRITGKSLSKQTLAIMPKINEVDVLMRENSKARSMVREVHPEICFWALAGGRPMEFKKKTEQGFEERVSVLNRALPMVGDVSKKIQSRFSRDQADKDDVLDAMAAAVTATVCAEELRTIPETPVKDSYDLPMEMVYSQFHGF